MEHIVIPVDVIKKRITKVEDKIKNFRQRGMIEENIAYMEGTLCMLNELLELYERKEL